MQVTLFGWVYMPLLLAVAIWARPWLLGLVLGSAVFQAAAVVNIPVGDGFYGISPYVASAGVAGCVMLWRRFGPDKNALWPPPPHIRTPAIWLLVYAAVAVLGSFVLPHVFAGLPVQPPLAANGYSLKEFPPLQWGISNLAQAANVCVHATVALFAWQAMGRADWSTQKTLSPFAIACGISVVAGLHDRLALMNDWPRIASFWMSNAGYELVDLADVRWINPKFPTDGGEQVLSYNRISSPFSEPSYGSAFLAALLAGTVTWIFRTPTKATWGLIATVFILAGLVNTLGTTGLLAAFLSLIVIFTWLGVGLLKPGKSTSTTRRTLKRSIMLFVSMGIFVFVVAGVASQNERFATAARYMLIEKFHTLEDGARFLSDVRGFKLAADTLGFGVGLGSNRTSSFISGLVSNTGVAGTLFFLAMTGALTWRYVKCTTLVSTHFFVAPAFGAMLLAACIGIPDLNLPILWAFIFLAFVVCPKRNENAETQAIDTP